MNWFKRHIIRIQEGKINPAVSLLGMYTVDILVLTHQETYARTQMVTLFTIAPNWK